MSKIAVVAEYREQPSEGIQVISKTLVDGLRANGNEVSVIEPASLIRNVPRLWRTTVVFTHGPGPGVVTASWVLRHLLRARIIWVATRPDLQRVPHLLRGRKTAHSVIANRKRSDLADVALGAEFVACYIGIDPKRVQEVPESSDPWPGLREAGRPIALHLGHLRRNRGLEALAETKRLLGDAIEVIVQGSPTFPPDPGVIEELTAAGVRVRRNYEPELHRLFRAADLYVFPVRQEDSGAIELPLGVLEAVASGTPVLSTPFGALPDALEGVDGVHFAESADFPATIRRLLEAGGLATRPTGLPEHLHAARTLDSVQQLLTNED